MGNIDNFEQAIMQEVICRKEINSPINEVSILENVVMDFDIDINDETLIDKILDLIDKYSYT